MRDWKPGQILDIVISELLGSFGDNELSPECLLGAQHLLKVNYASDLAGFSLVAKFNRLLV